MFAIGQFVQALNGGPKLKVVEINGENIVCVVASDSDAKRITHKASELGLYQEEGDFGVC